MRNQEDSGRLKTIQEKWKVKVSKEESREIKRHGEPREVKRCHMEPRVIISRNELRGVKI